MDWYQCMVTGWGFERGAYPLNFHALMNDGKLVLPDFWWGIACQSLDRDTVREKIHREAIFQPHWPWFQLAALHISSREPCEPQPCYCFNWIAIFIEKYLCFPASQKNACSHNYSMIKHDRYISRLPLRLGTFPILGLKSILYDATLTQPLRLLSLTFSLCLNHYNPSVMQSCPYSSSSRL